MDGGVARVSLHWRDRGGRVDLAFVHVVMAKLSLQEKAALGVLRFWLKYGALYGYDRQGRAVYIVSGSNGRLYLTYGTL